jgi:eukaryotic-like serine/threonine-protein kinase
MWLRSTISVWTKGTALFSSWSYWKAARCAKRCGVTSRFAAARTLSILQHICAALEAAHRRQLIHRDLKPENIFLVTGESAETAKVLDFGIAKFIPTVNQQRTVDTAPGAVLGTVRYMPPEQWRGGDASPAWDLWALAVVTYEMLTGAYPFEGRSPVDWFGNGLVARFTPMVTHLPEAPQHWQTLFASAFAHEPAQRPQSVEILLSELQAALS